MTDSLEELKELTDKLGKLAIGTDQMEFVNVLQSGIREVLNQAIVEVQITREELRLTIEVLRTTKEELISARQEIALLQEQLKKATDEIAFLRTVSEGK